MTAPNLIREAQTAVLAEYRLRRHAHRPHEAMAGVATHYAHSYALGAVRGYSADGQAEALARFEVADLYTQRITLRAYGYADPEVTALPYWRRGVLAVRQAVSA